MLTETNLGEILEMSPSKGIKRVKEGWKNIGDGSIHGSFIRALVDSIPIKCTIAELAHALSKKNGPTLEHCYQENRNDTFRIVNRIWLDELHQVQTVERAKVNGKTFFRKSRSNLKKRLQNLKKLQASLHDPETSLWQSLSDAIVSFRLLQAISRKKW